MAKFYGVSVGRETGVFETWAECEAQVKGFKGAVFKKYASKKLAQQAVDEHRGVSTQSSTNEKIVSVDEYITNSLSVDAACSGNPGAMEYQCVDTGAGTPIFASEVYPIGTNNIGEFLAVVDALKYLQENHDFSTPIYSDSVSAIAWVNKRRVNTNLPRNAETQKLWDAIDAATTWLYENEYQNPVLKWNTKLWGESKADYGRK